MAETKAAPLATREANVPAITDKMYELAVAAILDGSPLPAVDPEAVSRQILERILYATSFDEVFAPQTRKLPAWRDNLGRAAVVRSVHFNPTGIKDSASSVYAICDLVWGDTGEPETVHCGGRNVLMQLLAGVKNGWFTPDRQFVMTDKETGAGYNVLWLEDAFADNPLNTV